MLFYMENFRPPLLRVLLGGSFREFFTLKEIPHHGHTFHWWPTSSNLTKLENKGLAIFI
jgi:hypothetical protein